MNTNEQKKRIEATARRLLDNDCLNLSNELVWRALSSGGEWASAGYSWDNIVNNVDDEGECRDGEITQWWLVTDYLADLLEKDGKIILRTNDGAYWGRTGYGYSIELDFMDIAERIEEFLYARLRGGNQ